MSDIFMISYETNEASEVDMYVTESLRERLEKMRAQSHSLAKLKEQQYRNWEISLELWTESIREMQTLEDIIYAAEEQNGIL